MTGRSQEDLVAMLRSTKLGESVSVVVARQEDLFLPRELVIHKNKYTACCTSTHRRLSLLLLQFIPCWLLFLFFITLYILRFLSHSVSFSFFNCQRCRPPQYQCHKHTQGMLRTSSPSVLLTQRRFRKSHACQRKSVKRVPGVLTCHLPAATVGVRSQN